MFAISGTGKQRWVPLTLDPPPSRPPPSKGHRFRENRGGDKGPERERSHDPREKPRERVDKESYRGDHSHKNSGYRDNYRDRNSNDRTQVYSGGKQGYEHRERADNRKEREKGVGERELQDSERRSQDKERDYHRGKWRTERDKYHVPPRWANQQGDESGSRVGPEGGAGSGRSSGYGVGGYRGRGRNWRYPQCELVVLIIEPN